MNKADDKRISISKKMEKIYRIAHDIFSPESLILDEKISIKNNQIIIKPILICQLERDLFSLVLRNTYAGTREYDEDIALYFYLENQYLMGGIYNLESNKRITKAVKIDCLYQTGDEYINARRVAVFNKVRSLL